MVGVGADLPLTPSARLSASTVLERDLCTAASSAITQPQTANTRNCDREMKPSLCTASALVAIAKLMLLLVWWWWWWWLLTAAVGGTGSGTVSLRSCDDSIGKRCDTHLRPPEIPLAVVSSLDDLERAALEVLGDVPEIWCV